LSQFLVCVAIRLKIYACNPATPACVSGMGFSRVNFAELACPLSFFKILLARSRSGKSCYGEMPPMSDPATIHAAHRKLWLKKIVCFLIASMLLGWFYGWSSSRAFPKNTTMGFGYGMLHGALMPLALPSLLMGQDVKIFATENSGRIYKIGYICGINVCGLTFFGPLFWRPKRREESQKNQER